MLGAKMVKEPERGQVERCCKSGKIGKTPKPDVIPQPFLLNMTRGGLRRRLERRCTKRLHGAIAEQNNVLRWQANRRVSIGAAVDAAEDTFMNLGHGDANPYRRIVAQVEDLARTVAIIGAETGTRVIQAPVLVLR